MHAPAFWTELVSYLIFFPAVFICYLPMKNQLRSGCRRTILKTGVFLGILVPVMALVDEALFLGHNVIVAPALLLFLLFYHRTLKTPVYQSLSIFILVCALFAFVSNFANAFDAARNPHGSIDEFSLEAAGFQLFLSIAFMGLIAYPFWTYGSWLIDHFHIRNIWMISCPVSGIFLVLNILMCPRKYETLHTNNVGLYYYTALPLLLLLLFFLCVIFYRIVWDMIKLAEARERNRILEMEEGQYRKQQRYMEESAAARHDFRHLIGTLDEMLTSGNTEAAREYLTAYRTAMPKNEVQRYCSHPALNALLNYYAEGAQQDGIQLRITVDLPEHLPLSDVDLCNIVGNILDNAITASCDIPEQSRHIDLSIYCPNEARFGIVATNRFNGRVRMDGDRYLSSRRGGSGIGLASVRMAAERYGGTATFRHEGTEFMSGVVIPMKGKKSEHQASPQS